jgi:putative ABC transport system permease protein
MSTALVPLPNLLADLNMKDGQYQSLAIFLADASAADQHANHVIQELASSNTEGYRVTTVTEMSGQMGAVLGSVRWIGVTVFSIMLVLTMAGITNTYRMVLMERTKEIGMLRCIGFKRVDVFRIFLYEALLIAIAGSAAGIGASLPIGFLIHIIRFDTAGPLGSALSRGRLIFSPDGISLFILSVSVVLSSAIAVYGPARRASRLLPVEALRTTA